MIIFAAISGGLLSSFSIETKFNIAHLVLANDTLIFGEANLDHLHQLQYLFYVLNLSHA
jgi:hypothetical protein